MCKTNEEYLFSSRAKSATEAGLSSQLSQTYQIPDTDTIACINQTKLMPSRPEPQTSISSAHAETFCQTSRKVKVPYLDEI